MALVARAPSGNVLAFSKVPFIIGGFVILAIALGSFTIMRRPRGK